MEGRKKRIGIMGGTFDPIHVGHLILGETAYQQFDLEKVLFMPSGNPPHKRNRINCASDEERTDMVRLAISSNPHFELSLEEMNEDGYTYTYRTLERLNEEHPDTEFFFIIGADSLFDFDKWREPYRICQACKILVATRDRTETEELTQKIFEVTQKFEGTFYKMHSPDIDISSRMLREWIAEGRSLKYYVPDEVISYIQKNNIYKERD